MQIDSDHVWNLIPTLKLDREIVSSPSQAKVEMTSKMTFQPNVLTQLMETISDINNLKVSMKHIIRNKGCAGVDGETIEDLKNWKEQDIEKLREELLSGQYKPQALRRIKIPKPNGEQRLLSIPTTRDRVVQQAIIQKLTPIYDPTFCEGSYGYRPKRSAHDAIEQAQDYIRKGKNYILEIDIEKFFDRVNQDRLMTDMRRQIKDQRVLKLLREFLKAGALENGLVGQARQGVPQGSPMSPLLSNIYLTALDLELEKRGLSYVRYADDIRVFLGSMKSAERVKASLSKWIQKKLRLTVNTSKSGIYIPSKSIFLGYTITRSQKRLPREKRKLVNAKINTLTKRRTSKRLKDIIQEINRTMRGWLQYYKLAKIKDFIKSLVYRICRRLRCICLQKLKRFRTRVRFLVSQGINIRLAMKQCKTGQGLMQMSQREGVRAAMPNRWFHSQGLINFYEELKRKST